MIRSSLGEFPFNSGENVISMFIYTTPEALLVMTGFLSSHGKRGLARPVIQSDFL